MFVSALTQRLLSTNNPSHLSRRPTACTAVSCLRPSLRLPSPNILTSLADPVLFGAAPSSGSAELKQPLTPLSQTQCYSCLRPPLHLLSPNNPSHFFRTCSEGAPPAQKGPPSDQRGPPPSRRGPLVRGAGPPPRTRGPGRAPSSPSPWAGPENNLLK